MLLTLLNFGGFHEFETALKSESLPNGAGKTTILNAYRYALFGRCPRGFQPRFAGAADNQPTRVILSKFFNFPPISRQLDDMRATVYLGDEPMTQAAFAARVSDGIGTPFDLLRACSDACALTQPLSTDDMRIFLRRAAIADVSELRTRRMKLLKQRAAAEKHAVSTVSVPPQRVAALTFGEREYIADFERNTQLSQAVDVERCVACGQVLPDLAGHRRAVERENARDFIESPVNQKRYAALIKRRAAYDKQQYETEIARQIVASASRARHDVIALTREITEIDGAIAEITRASAVGLPSGVELRADALLKNGDSRACCQLFYKGVALSTLNYARKVQICVAILDAARQRMNAPHIPILVDNAESVQSLDKFSNLIKMSVL